MLEQVLQQFTVEPQGGSTEVEIVGKVSELFKGWGFRLYPKNLRDETKLIMVDFQKEGKTIRAFFGVESSKLLREKKDVQVLKEAINSASVIITTNAEGERRLKLSLNNTVTDTVKEEETVVVW